MLIFWGDSWTGHDLSQITGHKLFLPVPMGAQELSLDGQESQLYTLHVLPAAFWEHVDFSGSRSKQKITLKKAERRETAWFYSFSVKSGVLDQNMAVFI